MQILAKGRGKLQFSLRLMLVLCVVFGFLFAYSGSYYRISRRGMREAEETGLAGFLYVPFEDAAESKDLRGHRQLEIFFGPANWVDRKVFGGPDPITSITWTP